MLDCWIKARKEYYVEEKRLYSAIEQSLAEGSLKSGGQPGPTLAAELRRRTNQTPA